MNLLRRIVRDETGDLEDIPGWSILAIVSFIFISIILFVGRGASAANTVQAAAYAAARDASISRTMTDAVPHARDAANRALEGNVTCRTLDIQIGGNGLSTGLGQTGVVTATITCAIQTGDLTIPGVPGTITITKTASSPVDPYRER